jgi:VanZ family protein
MNSRPWLFRALTVGWMLLIFLLSSQPSLPAIQVFSGADLLVHAVVYGVLCIFLALSFAPPQVATWGRVFILTMLVTAYGVTDEYHQSFVPGRHASAWDVLADGAGGLIIAWTMHWRYRRGTWTT